MYDYTGLVDPNADRAIERTEEKLQQQDISPAERAVLEKKRLALRDKLMGKAKASATGKAKKRGKRSKADEPAEEIGIKEAKKVSADEHDMMAALMSDNRKSSKGPKLRPPTELQAPNLPEGLTRDSIFDVINQNQRAMSLCISQSMKAGEKLSGRMEVEMSIGATGTVRSAAIGTPRFGNTAIGKCTVKTVKRWKFPAFNGQPVTVIFPYVLSASF